MADFEEMRNAYLRATQDDIVTRLRNIHTMGQLGVVHEAADEIELLRTERNYWIERCIRAEECVEFMTRKKWWWQK